MSQTEVDGIGALEAGEARSQLESGERTGDDGTEEDEL